VSEARADSETLEGALRALVSKHPEALVTALADDGFRIPMPGTLELAEQQVIPVPADRATMVDLVVPADRMTVITTWERARGTGMAMSVVHLSSDPERPVSLTIIDAHEPHGVWLGILTAPEDDATESTDSALTSALLIPRRPRTATIHKNMFAVMTAIDDRTTRMLGWPPEQIVGLRSLEFIHPDDQERALSNWMEMLSREEGTRVRYRHRCQDGTWLWVEVEHFYRGAEDPDDVVVDAQVSDISDEMAAHEALDRREQLFHRLAESLPTGLVQVDLDRRVVYANTRLTQVFGVDQAATLADQLANVIARDRAAIDAAFDTVLDDRIDQELEVRARLPETGELRQCTVTLSALMDQEGRPGAIALVNDITESARLREELKVRATFDALTGCYNRASVLAALDQALATDPKLLAVIFVDLDHFKPVNDRLGHAAGDELLGHTGRSIMSLLRGDDIVGRIGGDEFLLVCQRLDDPAQALAIADRVARELHRPVALSSGTFDLRASVGLAFSDDSTTADDLVERADAAMYESKRRGLGLPVAFDDLALNG
jgi:diguanylate cyclase (GGDEF)-like protein/PAS domain S-box-containing protein